jgi:hypothetical protein
MRRQRPQISERGAVAIGILLALVMLQVMLVAAVVGGVRQQDMTVARVQSTRALYAAEAGRNMALREMMRNVDEDADGVIGSISNDNNDANDPEVTGARFHVVAVRAGPVTTLTSIGRADGTSRQLTATLTE